MSYRVIGHGSYAMAVKRIADRLVRPCGDLSEAFLHPAVANDLAIMLTHLWKRSVCRTCCMTDFLSEDEHVVLSAYRALEGTRVAERIASIKATVCLGDGCCDQVINDPLRTYVQQLGDRWLSEVGERVAQTSREIRLSEMFPDDHPRRADARASIEN